MNALFNTQDGELFEGVQSDINKARKGTPQYEEWLRKFKEKRKATKPANVNPTIESLDRMREEAIDRAIVRYSKFKDRR